MVLRPFCILTVARFEHPEKVLSPIYVTLEGMVTCWMYLLPENAPPAMPLVPLGIETFLVALEPSITTLLWITRRFDFEWFFNHGVFRNTCTPKSVTLEGIEIELSFEQSAKA